MIGDILGFAFAVFLFLLILGIVAAIFLKLVGVFGLVLGVIIFILIFGH